MANAPADPSGYVFEEQRRIDADGEAFDRLAYAMRALRVLRPRGLTVAVREGHARLRVEQGRAWGGRSPDARWALVAIPPTASRREIALAIAELAGITDNSLALAVLMTGLESELH